MTKEQIRALQLIAKAVISACQTFAPGGVIYAALMSQGCSLNQYQQIMAQLVQAGMVTQSGDCYTATEKGNKFIAM
jgi:predicted transcriptional regulator